MGIIRKLTDISSVFTTIFNQYINRNIGGIVLATDGIYNTGVESNLQSHKGFFNSQLVWVYHQ